MGRVRLDLGILVSAINTVLDQLNMTLTYNVKDLARKLNVSYTVAWRIVEKIKGRRMALLKAIVNYEILGLSLVTGIAEIRNENWLEDAKKLTYIHYYAPAYGTGGKKALFVLYPPKGLENESLKAVEKVIGPVTEHYLMDRALPAKIEKNGWPPKLDWSRVLENWYSIYAPSQRVSGTVKFDSTDLLVLSKLQEQGLWKVIDLAREVKLARKTMEYRLRQRIRWMVTGFKADMWSFAKNAPVIAIIAENRGFEQLSGLASIPYPSAVLIGKNSAAAFVAVPLEEQYPFLRALARHIDRWKLYFIDIEHARKFTVPISAVTERGTWKRELLKE